MPVNVSSSTSYTLRTGEDNLALTGAANINGTGNSLNNADSSNKCPRGVAVSRRLG
jgi:hypothetical protein